jgi:hypothetical protein
MLLIVPMGDDVGDEAQEPRMLSSDRGEAEVERRNDVRICEKEVVNEGKVGVRMSTFPTVLVLSAKGRDFIGLSNDERR